MLFSESLFAAEVHEIMAQGILLFQYEVDKKPGGVTSLAGLPLYLDLVPSGVKKVYLRFDTAAYVVELLKYCAEGKSERFGVIEFAVGADTTHGFKKGVGEVPLTAWHTLYREVNGKLVNTGQQYAGVCFVPNWMAAKKDGPT
jgi:hypothetical protein